MTLDEAKRDLEKFVKLKTTLRPAFVDVLLNTEEVKRGHWERTDAYPHRVYCSECYATLVPNDEWLELYKISSNYCPNCGAKMDEVEE